MLLLGIDLGTSSIKVSVLDPASGKTLVSVQYPDTETPITTRNPGWAEQSPAEWWGHVKQGILKANATGLYKPADIAAIGISYQMHGLVCVDKDQRVLRDSIIWCDSRAVELGNQAFDGIGRRFCMEHLLNSPGNFTASKLAWVKQHEPDVFGKIDKIMLPGDFIAMQLTGSISTSVSSISEAVLWDFKENQLSSAVLDYFGFPASFIPEVANVFSAHGQLSSSVAGQLSLKAGIPVAYKAGDQPNNALALNVLEPGEVAATAGTSGVIYAVTDELAFDPMSRVNSFAHVNHGHPDRRLGVLLCINGTGIMNRWMKDMFGGGLSYTALNQAAAEVPPGSDGLNILPFGNGAERMLGNRNLQALISKLDLNRHGKAELYRAGQEGIAFAFRYGLDIMRANGVQPSVIKAGYANMFMSDVFTDCFVNSLNVPVELYQVDGSVGAAIGAGIGAGIFSSPAEAFSSSQNFRTVEPGKLVSVYDELYEHWLNTLEEQLALIDQTNDLTPIEISSF